MFRREQQWTAEEEAALGTEPILGEPTAGMPLGWAGMGNAEREAHAMRVRAQRAGGAQQAPAAPPVNGAPQLEQARQQVPIFEQAFRELVATDAPQFRHAVGARLAAPARTVLNRMIGGVRAIEDAVTLGRTYATADASLGEHDRARQAEVLRELSRGDQILRGLGGVLLPIVAPAAYLKHSTGALPAPSPADPASTILAAGDGTVRALQTADGVRAILGGNPAAATEVQRQVAAALVVTQPQGATEAALLREILAERNLASLAPEAAPATDMFDIYAGITGEVLGGSAGRVLLPSFLEQSGAKQVASDIIASIYWSSSHAPAVFGQWWEDIKDDWPVILGTLVGFLAAEVVAAVLLASPHPAAQLAGAAIQAALLAVMVLGAAYEIVLLIGAIAKWLTLCRDAGGDPDKVHAASQAFCSVILRALMAMLAAVGGRAALRNRRRLRERAHETDQPVAAESGRVTEPVPGLYSSIDPDAVPHGWHFQEGHVRLGSRGERILETKIVAPNGKRGVVERAYFPDEKRLEMKVADFEKDLPRWIDEGTPMVEGKGTPTIAYVTMRQMKAFGIGYGSLQKVKMSNIQNVQALLELELGLRQGLTVEQAVLKTHSVMYADTALVQSGHQVASVKVTGGYREPINRLLQFRERRGQDAGLGDPAIVADNDALLAKYGIDREDPVYMAYDIHLELTSRGPE